MANLSSYLLSCRSPDDSMLVSCSIDNTVVVWRMPTAEGQGARPFCNNSAILNPFQTLRQHTSFVKVCAPMRAVGKDGCGCGGRSVASFVGAGRA